MVFVLAGAESAVESCPVKDFYSIQECEGCRLVPMLCTSIQSAAGWTLQATGPHEAAHCGPDVWPWSSLPLAICCRAPAQEVGPSPGAAYSDAHVHTLRFSAAKLQRGQAGRHCHATYESRGNGSILSQRLRIAAAPEALIFNSCVMVQLPSSQMRRH